MRTQRWLRRVIGLFPEQYRATRGDELHDALAEAAPTGRAAIREGLSLGRASATAWRKYLATPAGIRRAAFFGAMSWFGVLIAFGPVRRVQLFDQVAAWGFHEPEARRYSIIAACLLAVAFAAVFRYRWLGITAAAAGITLGAIAIQAGQWRLTSAIPYELSWLGIPLITALWLRGPKRVRWPAITSALPGVLLAVGPFGKSVSTPGYGYALSRLNEPYVPLENIPLACEVAPSSDVAQACLSAPYVYEPIVGRLWLDILIGVVGIIVIIGPWVFPASAAALLPTAVHISLLSPWPSTVAVTAYLAVALWIRVYWQPRFPIAARIRRSR